MTQSRWASVWHQLNEVSKLHPETVLEVGPGPGLFSGAARAFGMKVDTVDIDPDLNPDIVASATDIAIPDREYDVTCAFQVLEHLPFDDSMVALQELCRLARRGVVISLPDVRTCWPQTLRIPLLGMLRFVISHPVYRPREHEFNGQHYWEIEKQNFSLRKVISEMEKVSAGFEMKTFRVHENPYHRFFVFKRF